MNVLTASGNLGRDGQLNQLQSGSSVLNFAVAMKSGFGDNEQTVWLDCSIFGKRADSLAPYLVKGQQVVVSGEMGTREYNGKTYVTLRCNDVTLVGGKARDLTHDASPGAYQKPQPAPQQGYQQPQQAPVQQQAPQPQGFGQPTGQPAPQPQGFDDDIPFS